MPDRLISVMPPKLRFSRLNFIRSIRYTFTSASATLRKFSSGSAASPGLTVVTSGSEIALRVKYSIACRGVGEAIFHARVLDNRLGRFAQAVEHLPHDVHRLPFVGAFLFAAGLLVDVLRLGHLAGHFQRLLVLAQGEVAVGDDVPEAVEIIAVFVPLGKLRGRGDHRLVLLQFQHRVGQRERRLIGRGIFGIRR